MALELLSILYTFQNSTKCNEISFDPDYFFRITKRSIAKGRAIVSSCRSCSLNGKSSSQSRPLKVLHKLQIF